MIRVWEMPIDGGPGQSTHALALHTAPVASVRSSVSSNATKKQLLSAGWDGLVGYWEFEPALRNTDKDSIEDDGSDAPRVKKRRTAVARNGTTGDKLTKVHPTLVLSGHTGQVSRALFDKASSGTKAYSVGVDDHSVRHWDLNAAGQQIAMKQSDKAILDADQMADSNLIVTGNADRTVCLWDIREGASFVRFWLSIFLMLT